MNKKWLGSFLLLALTVSFLLVGCSKEEAVINLKGRSLFGNQFISVVVSKSMGTKTEADYMFLNDQYLPFEEIKKDVKENNPDFVYQDYGNEILSIKESADAAEEYLLFCFDGFVNNWLSVPVTEMGREDVANSVAFPVQYMDWSKPDSMETSVKFHMQLDTPYPSLKAKADFMDFYSRYKEITLTETEDGFRFAYTAPSAASYDYALHFTEKDNVTYVSVTK